MADSQKYGRTNNLFDVDHIIDGGNFYIAVQSGGQTAQMTASTNTNIFLLPCQPNTTYTVSRSVILKRFAIGFLPTNQIYNGMPVPAFAAGDSATSLTCTSLSDSEWLVVYYAKHGGSDSNTPEEIQSCLNSLMVNEGGTALPYQPYYGWQHSLRKLATATESVENPLYSDGTAITAYTLKGNTVQNGTPTPSNPVDVNGVGVRTENLLDYSTFVNDYWLNNNTGLPVPYNNGGRIATTSSIDVNNVNNVTFNFKSEVANTLFMYSLFNGSTLVERVSGLTRETTIDVSNGDTLYLCLYRSTALPITISDVSNAMLNVGSTAKPYEPYGYKIPISSGGVTTNIYLGSTSSTRQVRKLVLTGDEAWTNRYGESLFLARDLLSPYPFIPQYTALSTEYVYNSIQTGLNAGLSNGEFALQFASGDGTYNVAFKNTSYTDVTAWQNYLQQQYANNTPVTVWYVIATATTGTVNEPLMKIGDYADTLSNAASIPTTEGANGITVDTTVQPSEFTATWTGWHDSSVKEWDGSDWN